MNNRFLCKKNYRCDKCGKPRLGNADVVNSESIICWVCTLKASKKAKVSDDIKEQMSNNLQNFYRKVRDYASKNNNIEQAEKIAWQILKKVAVKGKNDKWKKKRGVVLETFNIKKEIKNIGK